VVAGLVSIYLEIAALQLGVSLGGPVHRTIRVTPAMESKLTDHIWTIAELLA